MYFERLRFSGSVTTTDATTTDVVVVAPNTLPSWLNGNVPLLVEARLVARDSTGNVSGLSAARAFKVQAGVLSALGATQSLIATGIGDAALTTIAVTVDASAGIIRLRATGIAITTITWRGFLEIWSGDL